MTQASATAERRQGADLLEHLHQVQLVPVLDEHAVLDAPDVDAAHLDRFAAGGDAHQVSGVGAAVDEAAHDAVTGDHQVLHRDAHVGQGGEERGPELAVGLASVGDEGVVVDVVLGDESVHQVRVVGVEHLDEEVGEPVFGCGHVGLLGLMCSAGRLPELLA